MVSINEKSKLIKIIQKEQLTEENKEELFSILSKLPYKELKSLLGKKYELFIKNYKNISNSPDKARKILSTGAERELIATFFEIVSPYVRDVYARNPKRDATLEKVISRVIAKKALEEGYTDFSDRAFLDAFKDAGHFHGLLEKYEFLFKFSNIFNEEERKILLKEIESYQERRVSVNKFLLQEYTLLKIIREAYFKKNKKYLSLNALSLRIIDTRLFSSHFTLNRGTDHFMLYVMFMVERWCIRNGLYSKEVEDAISKWRQGNNDDSIYAKQDTLLKEIAYSILVLYDQVKGKTIYLSQLDSILKEKIGAIFPHNFFKERLNRDSLVLFGNIFLLKRFVKESFEHIAPKETQQLIDKIEEYMKLPRILKLGSTHSWQFSYLNTKRFQLKVLIDITKGLDPLLCEFFEEEEPCLPSKDGIVRQHLDEDLKYDFIFFRFPDGEGYSYRFKLAPVRWKTHESLHDSSSLNDMVNDIIEARMRHLYELYQMEYNEDVSKQQYKKIFKEKFRSRMDYIFHYRGEVNIWSEFENGKVRGISDKTIEGWVDRWIDSKTKSEKQWYGKYYKKFYEEKYLPVINKAMEYVKQGNPSPWYDWFLYTYLLNETFPYHYPDE